ncbi:MAG: mechanosensitive ion channel family protein [Deltaproteobacteria bacterium]|jgi:small-conductance mechanosensitive channel|nr:mechanosensitive ion channel family protein [Deltaproteobacteria bacterium]
MLKKLIAITIMALAGLWNPVLLAQTNGKEVTDSAADQHVQELWEQNIAKYTLITNEINELLAHNDDISVLNLETKNLMSKFKSYQMVFQTSSGHPTEQTEVLSNMRGMRQKLEMELIPLDTRLQNLSTKLDEATDTRAAFAEMLDSGDPRIVADDQRLAMAIGKLATAKNGLESALKPIRDAISTLDDAIGQINVKIPAIWNNYYFGDSGSSGVFQSKRELANWLDSLSARLPFMYPLDKDTRSQAIFRLLITVAVMSTIASIILSNSQKIPEKFRDLIRAIIKGPWITLSLGLALISASMTQQGGNYLLLKLPGILVIIRTLATLSWKLRVATNPTLNDNNSPLHRFYVPAALGVALLFSDLPTGVVTAIWLIIMAIFLYYLWRSGSRALRAMNSLPEQIAYGSGIYFALGSLLVAIIGYSRLAILVFMGLFALANIIILGSALVVLTKMVCRHIFDPDTAPIKNAIVNALTLPCSFMLSLVSALPWLLAVPGSSYLLDFLMNRGYSVGSASISFYRVIIIIMLLLLFRSLGALANTSLIHLADKFQNIRNGFIQSFRTLMSYILWAIFAVIVLTFLGVNLTTIGVAITGLGVGLSLGLQTIVNNLFSGLILILGGNVQIDNFIEVNGVIGKVVGINIRCTVVETSDNSLVYVPNSSLVNGQFVNWTRNDRRVRRKLEFRIVYGTDIDKARGIIENIANHTEDICTQEPFEPYTSIADLSENAVIINLNVTIDNIDKNAAAQSLIREAVYKQFNANGIEFYIGSSLDVSLVKPREELGAPTASR